MKIISVVGARPNFMKIAPIVKAFKKHKVNHLLVHTGQHYDEKMSEVFFSDLQLPEPDSWLEVGPNTQAGQFATIMQRFEKVLINEKPDLVIVVGDVTSTSACAITASTLHIPVAHVEAGLRSFDKSMPEERNRILTDHIAELLFTTEVSGEVNLRKEGISEDKIHYVGNVMIDTLLNLMPRFEESKILDKLGLNPEGYAILTLHRPCNVDNRETLIEITEAMSEISQRIPIVFPMHPRTKASFEKYEASISNYLLLPPLGYLDFMKLFANSKLILTDSGGVQEEATILRVPCLTLRENTERPITVAVGINKVIGTSKERIIAETNKILSKAKPETPVPDLWDGKAAERIVEIIMHFLQN